MLKGVRKENKGIEYYMQLPYSILLHQVEEDGKKYWMAEFPQLPGCRSHGSTVEEAINSVEEAKRDWILDSLEEGEEIPVPVDEESYSGRFVLRMSRSLHRALSLMAENEGLSLNQLVVTILAKEAGRLGVLNRVEQKIDELSEKVDYVLKEQRAPSSRFHILAQPYNPQWSPACDVEVQAAVDVSAFIHGAVSTASPLEELSPFLVGRPSPDWRGITFGSTKAIGKEDAVETEHK